MQPVTLIQSGNTCTLSNGILSMYWKEDGTLGSLSLNGVELVCNLPERSDTNGKTAFYVDYHADGAFRKFHNPTLRIYENTEQMAHIAYYDNSNYLEIEYHIILRHGESGYYSYVIGANNTDAPFELAEFRIVYRCGSRVFDHAYNNERHGLQPAKKYMEQHEKLQDETYRLPNGEQYTNGDVYSKYDYAGYFSQNPCWGQYGHGYGFFVIPASTEYYPGGPMKQELLVHYDGILLNYFTGSHFGTGNLHVPIGWKKFYGPFYQYFNHGENPEELFEDALRTAKKEQAKWPYKWVNDPLYPLERSRVTGQLTFADGTPCCNTMVILGQKELPVELQTLDYRFYAETDEKGCFTLENVRMGTYSLYAYQTGGSNTNQLKVEDIAITEAAQQLPPIIWRLPAETVLWQLGKATRTCEGYRYAGELRNYKWMHMVPKTLHFHLGLNKESEDWYYMQPHDSNWYLHFKLDKLPTQECHLIIALAGASRGGTDSRDLSCLTISLNGQFLQKKCFANDAAIYRSATLSGRYRLLKIAVAPTQLHIGENIVEFSVFNGMVMYDTVLLTEDLFQ